MTSERKTDMETVARAISTLRAFRDARRVLEYSDTSIWIEGNLAMVAGLVHVSAQAVRDHATALIDERLAEEEKWLAGVGIDIGEEEKERDDGRQD